MTKTATKPSTKRLAVERPNDPEWAHRTYLTLLKCVGVHGRSSDGEESDGYFVPMGRGSLRFVPDDKRAERKDSAAYVNECIAWLLKHLGQPKKCNGCNAPIVWIRHIRGAKLTPYNPSGLNHFATCPARDRFRKPRSEPITTDTKPREDQV